jgi:hypothetical protein
MGKSKQLGRSTVGRLQILRTPPAGLGPVSRSGAFAPRCKSKLHAGSRQQPQFQVLSVLANDVLLVPDRKLILGDRRHKMAGHKQRDWRELCAAVTNEIDSGKLDSLVQELIKALDEGEREWRHAICSPNAIATNGEATEEVLCG